MENGRLDLRHLPDPKEAESRPSESPSAAPARSSVRTLQDSEAPLYAEECLEAGECVGRLG